ncbi:MAG: multidrug effflux MFS transporter [Pseudomonadota bacterium]
MILPDAAARAQGRMPLALLVFLALMTSMVALTIDAVLPALDAMHADLGFSADNERHMVIFAVFAGLGIAQVLAGPLADAYGRKPVAIGGIAVFLLGTLIAGTAQDGTAMIAGRFLQGLGAAGPRVVSVTIIRDLYRGDAMARVSSFVNSLFVTVPMVAPIIGQGIEALGGWRMIFWFYAATGLALAVWYLATVPETLDKEDRRALAPRGILSALVAVMGTGQTVAAIVIMSCAFGGFVAYLATAQQILEEDYALGPLFPLAFASLAGFFALASFLNGRLVMRFGALRLSALGLGLMLAAGAAGSAASAHFGGLPPLEITMPVMALAFAAVAILFANMVAIATAPHGHLAGTAAALVLAISTLSASTMGAVVASFYDGSLLPMFLAFTGLGCIATLSFQVIRRRRTTVVA